MRTNILFAAGLVVTLAPTASAELVLPRVSPKASVFQTIGLTDLTATYSRPGVKQRVIWGGLVPYDKPWRTGANEATVFTCTDDIVVAGQKLPAGSYAFFTIPTADEWTVIFSKQRDLWGAFDYDPEQDQLRLTVRPEMDQPHQEWMWLGFEDLTPTSCVLVLRWERLRLPVPITVEVNEKVLASCRAEVAAAKPDDWRTPQRAAGWCFDSGLNLDQAATWLARSLEIQQAYANLALKARWLAKEGKTSAAIVMARRAIEAGKASKERVDTSATEKLLAEWTAKK